jgi:hypothetical protein
MQNRWFICEGGDFNEGTCFYSERGRAMLDKRGHDRCIKHGRILTHDPSLDGLSRAAARRKDAEYEARNRREHAVRLASEEAARRRTAL